MYCSIGNRLINIFCTFRNRQEHICAKVPQYEMVEHHQKELKLKPIISVSHNPIENKSIATKEISRAVDYVNGHSENAKETEFKRSVVNTLYERGGYMNYNIIC